MGLGATAAVAQSDALLALGDEGAMELTRIRDGASSWASAATSVCVVGERRAAGSTR